MTNTVAALYRFTRLDRPESFRAPLLDVCLENGCMGTLLLAREGINGTIAGSEDGIARVLDWIRVTLPGCTDLEAKYSHAENNPFLRMKVRLKKEIVTMGVPDIDPNHIVGTYVEPGDWNDLIEDPDVVVIDTRNAYEVGIGTFQGAIDPKTDTFREFPDWVRASKELLPETGGKPRKVAMFCTGGIRCEKATTFLKSEGVEEVYHLKGGILKYLETVPEAESLWDGECFVFDQRVSVKHGLEEGTYDQCYACRFPITDADKNSPHYVPGVCCPLCHDKTDPAQKQRFAERQKQITLARRAGQAHLGRSAQTLSGPPDRYAEHADQAAAPAMKK